ncbi:dihydrofolate reductase [Chitinophaga sp. sic0106]|uniref:dihydrofolate reductase n=1 Tax=Chitinophaga sp. sic0106 TaxID=2854785 RepID=UPI001C47B740|nr:dihydrofolate reductase [Chitinophaga sp. sic0106]MBV7534114.1 dihydrofolate reductase [Chitinophaga sp. sic0106]
MKTVSIIVAASDNDVIGINNMLPWRLPDDLKYFKNTTTGKPIIMGRKTFESLGKPLPNRPNIVITRQTDYQPEGTIVVDSLQAAVDKANTYDVEEIFITGGAQIFVHALPLVDKIYMTRVSATVPGDAFFPMIDPAIWNLVSDDRHEADERNQYAFTFQVWERIPH